MNSDWLNGTGGHAIGDLYFIFKAQKTEKKTKRKGGKTQEMK